jgi:S1-C subfamily serine protease
VFILSTLQRPVVREAAASLVLALCLIGRPSACGAQTAAVAPARATVYVRLIGDLEVVRPPDVFGAERRVQESGVQLSTGSGVLISPVGHVLTAAHVVTAENGSFTVGGIRVQVRQTVRKIEVLPPGDDTSAAPGPFEATILAIDPDLDLAVLAVNGTNLPFLDLGDSDALTVGDAVEAVGFPFGEQVEIGRPREPLGSAPAPSVSRGNLSAFRGDTQGDRRYVQVTAPLNAGNSGGPVVDADGYVVAIANSVMRSRGTGATGVGFGVPVNLVKRFLEMNGLDSVLRARRIAAGPFFSFEGKGLRIPLPVGMSDASPLRARVDAGSRSADGVVLHVDRVISAWPAARVAEALVSGRAFEPFAASSANPPQPVEGSGGRLILGHATGAMDDGTTVRMEYAVVDAGAEKVVARFIGPPHQVAYNAWVLRAALRQIDMDRLRVPARTLAAPWAPRASAKGTPIDDLRFPADWLPEAAGPFACRGLPAPSDAVSLSPPTDFTVALRAGWLSATGVAPQDAASACGAPAARDVAAYSREWTFLGTPYRLEGRFVATGGGLLQMEFAALADQAAAWRTVFRQWTGQ